jgi:hypothetical protein
MNNLNNLLITLFTALFCYILFYWIYKSCFAYKIIEGVDETTKNDSKTDSSTEPKKVTSDTRKKEDEENSKPPSEEDNKEKLDNIGSDMQSNNEERKNSTAKGVPSDKLLTARFK